MKLQAVSFQGNIGKGREEFKKLSMTEQAVKMGIESFRQKYNRTHFPALKPEKGNLGEYVHYRLFIQNLVQDSDRMKDIFRKSLQKLGL